ncbi:glycoside hydrolase family 30 protein [Vallitalea guaymasensis]|uniref:glycoside hydrolase family 30 protein n=1 Tax=Vallitalea guaymasensis TaxID=1185412 RepID=UPI000DE2E3DA|nr:glycoside hydrolase [Vallitalea guaymasensis]
MRLKWRRFLVLFLVFGLMLTITKPYTNSYASNFITIYWEDEKQEIDGFGFSGADWSHIPYQLQEPERTEVMDLLFNIDDGIGASICRSEIHPEYSPALGEYDFVNIKPEQLWYIKEAEARGVDKQIATAWTPPAFMKNNNSQTHGGYLIKEYYDDFADLLSEFVVQFEQLHGIDFYAVSMCNEPNASIFLNWNSCSWKGEQIKTFIKDYMKPAFVAKGIDDTKFIIAEPSWWSESLMEPSLNDPVTCDMIDIVGSHQYQLSPSKFTTAFSKGKKVWQTEVCDPGHFDAGIGEGLRWAKNIHEFMVDAEASAYLYWQGVMREGSEGLICTNSDFTDYVMTKRYYTFGHFSKFIRPGYVRIGTSDTGISDTYISAYKNKETGDFTIVAINDTDKIQQFDLLADGFSADKLTPYITDDTLDLQKGSQVPYNDGTYYIALPPKSVVTYVGKENSNTLTDVEVIEDNLDDWSTVYSKSDGWFLDSSNSEYFEGDLSRAARNSGKNEELVYYFDGKDINFFEVKLFQYWYFDALSFYASEDNINWIEIPHSSYPKEWQGSRWYKMVHIPRYIPEGTKYIKVKLTDNSTWEKQISKIKFILSE